MTLGPKTLRAVHPPAIHVATNSAVVAMVGSGHGADAIVVIVVLTVVIIPVVLSPASQQHTKQMAHVFHALHTPYLQLAVLLRLAAPATRYSVFYVNLN